MKSNESESKGSVWNWRSKQQTEEQSKGETSARAEDSATDSNAQEGELIQFHTLSKPTSQVALIQILDAFRLLEDPQARIFGGVMFGTSWDTERGKEQTQVFESLNAESIAIPEQPHFPLVSGVASPGSRVTVTLADEAGVMQDDITVYADAAGNWIAPFEGTKATATTWLVEIAILPAAWSGTVEPRNLMVSLPGGKILSHEDIHSTKEGELYGVIFATDGSSLKNSSSLDW